ncbi:MAG: cytidine deaminase [Alphaproteobacteria bacterium]|nr:cytidine deaminase [Alphaproteobacteria bacterium]
MMAAAMADRDRELIEAAREAIRRLYQENRHHIGAAVRGRSGRVYSAVHLDTYVGRASVCAEAVALGKAISEGESGIEAIVSVRHPRPAETNREIHVVSPCGICREMLSDFAPGCLVITPDGEGVRVVPVEELLPNKYRRRS